MVYQLQSSKVREVPTDLDTPLGLKALLIAIQHMDCRKSRYRLKLQLLGVFTMLVVQTRQLLVSRAVHMLCDASRKPLTRRQRVYFARWVLWMCLAYIDFGALHALVAHMRAALTADVVAPFW
jgi:hypothetical protein